MVSLAPAALTRGLSTLGPLILGDLRVDPPVLLAPMAGVSEAPYRAIALELGAGLAPTELVSAKGLELKSARTEAYLRHDPAREPILSVQLFGGDPAAMALAAEIAVDRGAKIVDINMGCPVRKVTRSGAGAALLADPERAENIVDAVRRRVGARVPVTAKIRSGWDDAHRNAVEVGRRLEDVGLAAIALHPRTRTQGYSGRADWSEIARLKAALRIPVIANGDITGTDDAHRVVDETGCDAVMIGRAALGNPWIFRSLSAAHRGLKSPPAPTTTERTALVLAHLTAHLHHVGDEQRGVRGFRQHILWYSRGFRGAAAFRAAIMKETTRAGLEAMIDRFFSSSEQGGVGEPEPVAFDERRAHG